MDGRLEAAIDGRHFCNRRSRNHKHQQNSSKSNQIDERFSQGATLNLQELGSKLEVSLSTRVFRLDSRTPQTDIVFGHRRHDVAPMLDHKTPPFSCDSTIFYKITWTNFFNPAVFKTRSSSILLQTHHVF